MHENKILLTTREASSILGVHDSSIKRWCDRGRLECDVTAGGHRRISLDALVRFATRESFAAPLLALDRYAFEVWSATDRFRSGDGGELVDLSFGWMDSGPEEHLAALLQFMLDQGFAAERLADLLLGPLVRRIGREWERGCIGVGDEHRMTQVLLDALYEIRGRRRHPTAAPTAIVATSEGNRHELGAQMVRLVLERGPWRVVYLGADVPTAEIVVQQRRHEASLVCLSFVSPQIPSDVYRVVDMLAATYNDEAPFRVAVGGAGASGTSLESDLFPFTDIRLFERIEPFSQWAADILSLNQRG